VGIGVAVARAVEPRQGERGAQFEALRLLMLSNRHCGLQFLLGRRSVRGIALQQNFGAEAMHFRLVPALLGALRFGERVVQAPEPGSDLAGACFGG
jgi:hypothetical protein